MYLWSLEMPYQGLWQRCDVTLWGLCAVFYEGSLGMYRLSSISRPLFLPKATACIQVREMDKMLSPMSRERASLLHPVLVSFHVNESHLHKTPTLSSSSSLIPTWCWGWRLWLLKGEAEHRQFAPSLYLFGWLTFFHGGYRFEDVPGEGDACCPGGQQQRWRLPHCPSVPSEYVGCLVRLLL